MTQSYTAKITKNSLWATSSFIAASLCNFGMSVAVTRYFGTELYGQYSYFLWLSSVLAIVAGFGFQQTVTKYIPKYFFKHTRSEADAWRSEHAYKGAKHSISKANLVFRKLLSIQIIGSMVISALCILGVRYFQHIVNFDQPDKSLLLIITFLSIVPVSISSFLSSSLTSIQEFQKLSKTYIGTSIVNLILIVGFVLTKQSIVNFLLLYCGLSFLSMLILLAQSWNLTKPVYETSATSSTSATSAPKKTLIEKMFSYSLYAYIGFICTQVVWERSELFFLGAFSNSNQIAIYTLSYALAVLFISVWGPLNGVMNSVTSEVVMTEKHDKLVMITQHGTKYLAMLILPLALFASLFLGDVVSLVYGKSFQAVATLFPFLVLSHAVAVIITPAGSIPMLKHEMKKTMFFNIATAALNIILDFYLISKYEAFGAMLANVISQFFSIGLSLINAKKYGLGIFNKYMIRVFVINALLAGLFIGIVPFSFPIKIIITIVAAISYFLIMLKIGFNQKDVAILNNLKAIMPRPLHPLFSWCVKTIQNNDQPS